jgi:hypothetical protein
MSDNPQLTDFTRAAIDAEAPAEAARVAQLEHVRNTIAGLEATERQAASVLNPVAAVDAAVASAGLAARSEQHDEVADRIAEAGLSEAVIVRRPSEGT